MDDAAYTLVDEDAAAPRDAAAATPTLMGLASPIIANQMIGIFIPSFLTIAAVGQAAGARAVAALAMATTFANITGWSLVVGISEGCDTLASQAYGAGQHAVCGAILQRGVALSAAGAAVVTVLWTQAERALIAFGQPRELARMAGAYCLWYIPALWAFAAVQPLRRWLTALGVTRPFFFIGCVQLVVQCAAVVALLGARCDPMIAAAAAWGVSHAVTLVVTLAFAARRSAAARACWRGWSRSAVCDRAGLATFARLALPAYTMLGLEWWTFEIATLLAGLLPHASTALAAENLGLQLVVIFFMIPLGVGTAVATRVGQLLGARETRAARRVPPRGLACFAGCFVPLGALMLLPPVQRACSKLFVSDAGTVADDDASGGGDDVDGDDDGLTLVALFARIAPWVVLEQAFDGVKEVLNGTLRGLGQQAAGVVTSFVAYAVVMVPLMIVFAFEVGQSWAPGVPGLFVGMTCGSATHAALNLLLALRWTDFEKASEIAYERANAAAAKDDEQAAGRVDAPA